MRKYYLFGLTREQVRQGLGINLFNTARKAINEHLELFSDEKNNALFYSEETEGEYFSKIYVNECLYRYFPSETSLSPMKVITEEEIPSNATPDIKL